MNFRPFSRHGRSRSPASTTVAIGVLSAFACLAACDRTPPANGDEKSDKDKVDAPKIADAAAADDSCEEYGKSLCEIAGEENATCTTFKSIQDVIAPEACAAGLGNLEHSKAAIAKLGETCDELMTKLCADLGEETKTCSFVKEQTPSFPPDRCKTMLDQYDTVLADLKQMEAKNKPLDETQQQTIAAGNAPAFGPADAKVTLVEFSDFQCPYCSKAADVVGQVKEKYGDKVRFVFRQFPLPMHTEAHAASQAALAAHAQGKFWEYHDVLFANQRALKDADLEKYAQDLKLDMAAFKKAMTDKAYSSNVDGDLELGKGVAVNSTPTVFINGERVGNPTSFDEVAAEIDKLLAG